MRIRLLLLLWWAVTRLEVYAQSNELKFEHLSKEDGLTSSDVTSVVQDKEGFIWIGTIDGLNRYDGYTVKTYRNNPEDPTSLCDNKISVLYVDHIGDLWIGTENNGLSRYNKETDSFINYKASAYNPQRLSFHYVTSIIEDKEQNLWVGTLSGLNRFDRKKQHFQQYLRKVQLVVNTESIVYLREKNVPQQLIAAMQHLQEQEFAGQEKLLATLERLVPVAIVKKYKQDVLAAVYVRAQAESIRSLEADAKGNLWIGFEQAGLARFNPASGDLQRFRHIPGNSNSLSNNEVMSLKLDGQYLWVGTRRGGLNRLHIPDKKIQHYPYQKERSHIKCIIRDSKNAIWFGDGYALYRFNRDLDSFTAYEQQSVKDGAPVDLAVSALHEDIQGNLWVACYQGGVNRTVVNNPFRHFAESSNSRMGLSKSSVSAVLKDSKGNLWVGYFKAGIDFWDAKTNLKTHYSFNPNDANSLGEGTVFSIFEDSKGRVWVGTYRGGLQYFDETHGPFISYRHKAGDKNSISGNDVRAITEDAQQNLWIAVHGGGINKLDVKTNTFKHYRASYGKWQHTLANDWAYTVYTDSKGRVWAGTVAGVSVLKPGAENFISYNKSNSALSHNSVRSVFEDHSGNIWVGTENGLNYFDEQKDNFVAFTEKDGLPNNFIMGGMADAYGNLWVSTNNGLAKFDYTQQKFRNYSMLDGLQSNEFFPGAYFKAGEGEFYFGGKSGLNVFDPGCIRDNAYKAPVIITDFKLFNKPVRAGEERSPLNTHISQTRELVLEHDQNVISFGFVALNFVRPEKNQYAYMMQGFEREWTYVGNKREATYTNLDPGKYIFRVKAANNDGLWNEQEATLLITVLPPFWQSGWAYLLYACCVLSGLYAYRSVTLQRERVRTKQRLERLEAEKAHELDTMKLNFFANISHEFRTPLTLISDPIDRLIEEEGTLGANERRGLHKLIQRNSRLLLRLINQLLDISEADAGMMQLKVVKWDVVQFCRAIANVFNYKANRNNIVYIFSSEVEAAEAYFDPDKLEKILYNLLSNAFKFTPEYGRIAVRLALVEDVKQLPPQLLQHTAVGGAYLKLDVEDDGVGISPEEQEKIFERFFQVVKNGYRKKGTGIGLTLVKQLVERHHGEVQVVSEPGKGTKFTVWLPVTAQQFSTEEFEFPTLHNSHLYDLRTGTDIELSETSISAEGEVTEESPLLLIVEDSLDVRRYLRFSFEKEYRVEEARNGAEGLEKALIHMPDLIISDVLMPELSGLELCQRLKIHESTCHIPVILLTAQKAEHCQLMGLERGADDYVSKPFSMPLLKAKVKNLISSRKLLKRRFAEDLSFKPEQIATNSLDEKFMEQAMKVIELHLADSNFSPEVLAEELGMSRSQLYRKLKGLTGLSVSIFIRNTRLRQAAKLLQQKELTVAEVAYTTGFSDPAYFTKCFKEQYAKTPTDFMHHV